MEFRIYYEDTDCGGVVYYANYLRYFERARTEFLRDHGVEVGHWMAKGLLFTVAEAQVKYHAPARYDDLLSIDTRVTDVRRVCFYLAHDIVRPSDGRRIVSGTTTMACVDGDGRPTRVPDPVMDALQKVAGAAPA